MDCHEVREHISSAVDNRLEHAVRSDFDAHIAACPLCRNEFELEKLTKRLLQKTLKRSRAPAELSSRIVSNLSPLATEISRASWLAGWWVQLRLRPAFAVGILAVLALALFVSLPLDIRHMHTSPADNNVIHQSFNNYDALLAGTLKPDIASSDPTEVKIYVQQRVDYRVRVPKMDKCKLLGGLVSDYQGKPLAHLVYKFNDRMIYVYEVDMATVLEGKTLMIPAGAREELLRTGWHVQSPHPNCSLVMWVVDNTLCTVVADLDKTELIAYLSYSDEQ